MCQKTCYRTVPFGDVSYLASIARWCHLAKNKRKGKIKKWYFLFSLLLLITFGEIPKPLFLKIIEWFSFEKSIPIFDLLKKSLMSIREIWYQNWYKPQSGLICRGYLNWYESASFKPRSAIFKPNSLSLTPRSTSFKPRSTSLTPNILIEYQLYLIAVGCLNLKQYNLFCI